MSSTFRERLSERVLLFDGAMGTELYSKGVFINRCYDDLCVTQPEMVREIHAAYRQAGADVLTTNSFGGNPVRLAAFGLEGRMKDINAAAVKLAKAEARDRCLVAASIGPTGATLAPVGKLSPGEAFAAFKAQAEVLADAGADLIILETFSRLGELWQAVRAVKAVCDLPIVACMSFHFVGPEQAQLEGENPEDAIRAVKSWGVDAFGTNCSNGPRGVQRVIERLLAVSDMKLAAIPNAGLPQVVDGRTLYLAAPEYMAEYARRFVQMGASIVGGCCGTTPLMIKEISGFIRSVTADRRLPEPVTEAVKNRPSAPPTPPSEKSELGKKCTEESSV